MEESDKTKAFDIPRVSPLGTRRTLWINFSEICAQIGVSTEVMAEFISVQLGTECHEYTGHLSIKGRFSSSQIQWAIQTLHKST